jgi:hypothetical protein
MVHMEDAGHVRLAVHADRRLAEQVRQLGEQRMVFVAGLPGTGKSLLIHQLAHLASGAGRRIHLLQWDVARPVLEASPAGRRYPLVDGVTHVVIRKAAGLWVRRALIGWSERHPEPEHLVIGETPFVGSRFVELARRIDDRAEGILAGPRCRFAIAAPSREVRRFLESERARRTASPRHPREREDAPPHVLRDLWDNLAAVARQLGVTEPRAEPTGAGSGSKGVAGAGPVPYDPDVYARVYQAVLRHRHTDVVVLDVILPTEAFSVYDFAVALPDLVPTESEAEEFIREVERRYPDLRALEREVARWWEV